MIVSKAFFRRIKTISIFLHDAYLPSIAKKMKKLVTICFLLLAIQVFAQKAQLKKTDTLNIGINNQNNQSIKGIRYTFKSDLMDVKVDSVNNLLIVRNGKFNDGNTGNMFTTVFNPDNMQKLRESKSNGSTAKVLINNDLIYELRGNGIVARKSTADSIQWKVTCNGYLYLRELGIFLIEGPSTEFWGKPLPNFQCIDAKNGTMRWGASMNFEKGWLAYEPINDTLFAIIAEGLAVFHLNKGLLWYRKFATTAIGNAFSTPNSYGYLSNKKNYLTSAYYVRGFPEFWNLSSNIAHDSCYVYCTNIHEVVCYNLFTGEKIWFKDFGDQRVSRSNLHVIDSLLIQIDCGFAQFEEGRALYGRSCLRAFNKRSGKLSYEKIIGEKTDFVNEAMYIPWYGSLYLVLQNRIQSYNPANGYKIVENMIDKLSTTGIFGFRDNLGWYKDSDGRFKALNHKSNTIYLKAKAGVSIEFDKDLNFKRYYGINDVYNPLNDFNKQLLLVNAKGLYLVDSLGSVLTNVPYALNGFCDTKDYVFLVDYKLNTVTRIAKQAIWGLKPD